MAAPRAAGAEGALTGKLAESHLENVEISGVGAFFGQNPYICRRGGARLMHRTCGS